MKLRNKKTGEIKEYTHTMTSYHVPIEGGYEIFTPWNPEEWEELEDVKEPLIKDEKIRKAVRAWAEANAYSLVRVGYDMASEPNDRYVQIHFEGSDIVDEDKYGVHTIAELCGEEK